MKKVYASIVNIKDNLDHVKQWPIGEKLYLKREPDNPHDPNAIMVLTQSGEHVGYVSAREETSLGGVLAQDLAKHLDAKKQGSYPGVIVEKSYGNIYSTVKAKMRVLLEKEKNWSFSSLKDSQQDAIINSIDADIYNLISSSSNENLDARLEAWLNNSFPLGRELINKNVANACRSIYKARIRKHRGEMGFRLIDVSYEEIPERILSIVKTSLREHAENYIFWIKEQSPMFSYELVDMGKAIKSFLRKMKKQKGGWFRGATMESLDTAFLGVLSRVVWDAIEADKENKPSKVQVAKLQHLCKQSGCEYDHAYIANNMVYYAKVRQLTQLQQDDKKIAQSQVGNKEEILEKFRKKLFGEGYSNFDLEKIVESCHLQASSF